MSLPGARMLFEQRGPKLPYDAEVEWIETDGVGSYINTGINSSLNFSLEIDCQLMSKHNLAARPNSTLFGARGSASFTLGARFSYMLTTSSGKNLMYFRVPTTSPSEGPENDYERHVIRITATECYIDDVSVPVTSPVTSSTPYLGHPFCIGRDGILDVDEDYRLRTYANARFYAVKIYENGIFVRDMIPVCFTNELGQAEGAMYDRVSGEIFRNQGTGAFGFGTDIAGGGYKCLGRLPWHSSRFSRLWKEAA